ncbi:hypothetical protein J2Y68_003188 [Paenarthrobacter nitroguajacolicus]|nr:hypothetical protein [Paenarthrobacter nitroguajacolicus]
MSFSEASAAIGAGLKDAAAVDTHANPQPRLDTTPDGEQRLTLKGNLEPRLKPWPKSLSIPVRGPINGTNP